MRKKLKKLITNLLKIFFTALFLYLAFREINLSKLIEEFENINWFAMALAMTSYFFLNITITYRLYKVLEGLNKKISFKSLLFKQFFGMLASDFSPGRAGYLSLTLPLKKEINLSISEGTSILLTIQAIEFMFKSSVSLLGLLYLKEAIKGVVNLTYVIIGLFALIAMGLGFLFLMWFSNKWVYKILLKVPYGDVIEKTFRKFTKASVKLKKSIKLILVICFFGWVLRGIEWYFLTRAANMPLSFIACLALQPLLTTIRFIPITISGLGTYELALIEIFKFFGIPGERVIIFSLLDRIDNTLINLIGLKEMKNL